jgi:hypothetical protein
MMFTMYCPRLTEALLTTNNPVVAAFPVTAVVVVAAFPVA